MVAHASLVVVLAVWVPFWVACAMVAGLTAIAGYVVVGFFCARPRPKWRVEWVDLPVLCHVMGTIGILIGTGVAGWFRGAPRTGALPGYSVGCALGAWGIWGQRRRLRVPRLLVRSSAWPARFDGYSIVQLSDLHVGDFETPSRARHWVEVANSLRADLCVVTGDLVARGAGREREVTTVLSELRAADGVMVILGNHDRMTEHVLTSELRAARVLVLRNQWHCLRRGADRIWVLGVDDWRGRWPEIEGFMAERSPSDPVILLAHRRRRLGPTAQLGVDLALYGHTHGGQIGLPFVGRWANLMALTGQRAQGLFQWGRGCGYISAGLGTSGPPMRVGVDPEIVVITLRSGAG